MLFNTPKWLSYDPDIDKINNTCCRTARHQNILIIDQPATGYLGLVFDDDYNKYKSPIHRVFNTLKFTYDIDLAVTRKVESKFFKGTGDYIKVNLEELIKSYPVLVDSDISIYTFEFFIVESFNQVVTSAETTEEAIATLVDMLYNNQLVNYIKGGNNINFENSIHSGKVVLDMYKFYANTIATYLLAYGKEKFPLVDLDFETSNIFKALQTLYSDPVMLGDKGSASFNLANLIEVIGVVIPTKEPFKVVTYDAKKGESIYGF